MSHHYFPLQTGYESFAGWRKIMIDYYRTILFIGNDIPNPFIMYSAIDAFDRYAKKYRIPTYKFDSIAVACLYLSEQFHSPDREWIEEDMMTYSKYKQVVCISNPSVNFLKTVLKVYQRIDHKFPPTIVDNLFKTHPHLFEDKYYYTTSLILTHTAETNIPYYRQFVLSLESINYKIVCDDYNISRMVQEIINTIIQVNNARKARGDLQNAMLVDRLLCL